MAHILSIPEVGLIIDSIYRNYSKSKTDQKSIQELTKECNAPASIIMQIRNILRELHILIIEGEKRGQKCYWHPDKCTPNPAMLTNVYRTYTINIKSKIKIERKIQTISEKQALNTLVKLGYIGEIYKSWEEGYTTHTKTIQLSKIKIEE